VEVEGLGIELPREILDLARVDEPRAARERAADREVVEVERGGVAHLTLPCSPRNQVSTNALACFSSEKLFGASTQLAMRPETSDMVPIAASRGLRLAGRWLPSMQARNAPSMVFRHSCWLATWRSRTP